MSSLATHLVEGRRRCPQAAAFVTGFKTKKLELARHLLRLINAEVFEDRWGVSLALAPDLEIKFNKRMLRTAGFCYSKQTACGGATVRTARIELSEKVVDSAERLRDTLVHELCHAVAWVVYEIRCKYTYRCTRCGYSFGRHSKSLDTQRKDNYGSVKKDSAGLKHAEIMRVLGQQFAAAKITKEGEK
ncbi:acidic repeat-containing protein-like, partial [Pollicipes pollicipes]|uniref:acidic repeat-containing protein-like n=1 Tax=Pollicipes pollicipes TaxID=41117 RepID=UPI001884C07A